MARETKNIAIIGLGYVGLPLAVEFGQTRATLGFDIDASRIKELKKNIDRTREVSSDEMARADHLLFSADQNELKDSEIYIVTVPTPIDNLKKPDLTPLYRASETVGQFIKDGDIVIYESTVYPGCIEDDCVPVLEKTSNLKLN